MRILGGTWCGRNLKAPKGIRPMTELVKQALFQVLGDVSGLKALDLFAGSGQLGIEALSRGAQFAAFVEAERKNAETIRDQLKDIGVSAEAARVLTIDALKYLKTTKTGFDLIFADPPYEMGLVNPCWKAVFGSDSVLAPGGRLALRHTKHEPLTEPDAMKIKPVFERRYGDDVLTIWRKQA